MPTLQPSHTRVQRRQGSPSTSQPINSPSLSTACPADLRACGQDPRCAPTHGAHEHPACEQWTSRPFVRHCRFAKIAPRLARLPGFGLKKVARLKVAAPCLRLRLPLRPQPPHLLCPRGLAADEWTLSGKSNSNSIRDTSSRARAYARRGRAHLGTSNSRRAPRYPPKPRPRSRPTTRTKTSRLRWAQSGSGSDPCRCGSSEGPGGGRFGGITTNRKKKIKE